MEYILLLLIFLAGTGCGWRLREISAVRSMNKILNIKETLSEEEQDDLVRVAVKIERVDGELMVYSIEDNLFMAQGLDWDEIEERLTARFPGKKFHASQENLIEMGFKL
tara:strand:- start:764 stop:1090 length:327 start_codon:yes stop_codon:yes gene_type:complete